MAGLIRSEDVQTVKERTPIEDIVREHVTLRPGGTGSLKGLCPFHDEKTPSFNVRPAVGAWHCFGCNEGGDVISFVMKIDHLTFSEAVERLAGKLGMELRYEEGSGRRDGEVGLGRRTRLLEAHRTAAEFYQQALLDPDSRFHQEARAARDFLRAKGFDGVAARQFGVGFAPRTGDALTQSLLSRGFTPDELVTAGLSGRSHRGLYDRFRGRVLWPIRDITGDTVGFGARRLFDDDTIAAKYLNTSETPIYKKTSVLYGLDLAKKEIASQRRAVIVEGYTDVMACHLAGVTTAVATCGTAFGGEHIKVLRRLLRDEPSLAPARVIFTFDGDTAGQKAAMKAFDQDQQWASQSYVAVAPAGQDPNELRESGGDEAVRALVEDAVPIVEYAVRTTVAGFDLDRTEERVQAMRAVAPILAGIRDRSLRPEYTRTVAGWLGVGVEQLGAEVARAPAPGSQPHRRSDPGGSAQAQTPRDPELPMPDLRNPRVQAERQLLQVALQYPAMIRRSDIDAVLAGGLSAPMHTAILQGLQQAAAVSAPSGEAAPEEAPLTALAAGPWTAEVANRTVPIAQPLVHELAVAGVPVTLESSGRPPQRYVDSLVVRALETGLERQIENALSGLQRAEPGSPDQRRLREHLTGLHREKVRLRARVEG